MNLRGTPCWIESRGVSPPSSSFVPRTGPDAFAPKGAVKSALSQPTPHAIHSSSGNGIVVGSPSSGLQSPATTPGISVQIEGSSSQANSAGRSSLPPPEPPVPGIPPAPPEPAAPSAPASPQPPEPPPVGPAPPHPPKRPASGQGLTTTGSGGPAGRQAPSRRTRAATKAPAGGNSRQGGENMFGIPSLKSNTAPSRALADVAPTGPRSGIVLLGPSNCQGRHHKRRGRLQLSRAADRGPWNGSESGARRPGTTRGYAAGRASPAPGTWTGHMPTLRWRWGPSSSNDLSEARWGEAGSAGRT